MTEITANYKAQDPTPEQVRHFMDTVYQAVVLRLDAGDDVGDAMLTGNEMMRAWVAAHVDGAYSAS